MKGEPRKRVGKGRGDCASQGKGVTDHRKSDFLWSIEIKERTKNKTRLKKEKIGGGKVNRWGNRYESELRRNKSKKTHSEGLTTGL